MSAVVAKPNDAGSTVRRSSAGGKGCNTVLDAVLARPRSPCVHFESVLVVLVALPLAGVVIVSADLSFASSPDLPF